MKNLLLGSIALVITVGCSSSILGGSGGDSIVGVWENYGYSEQLEFTITSTVTIHSDGDLTAREIIRPTKAAEGWIKNIIPTQTEEIEVRYRGHWSDQEIGRISFEFNERTLYFDDELSVGSVTADETDFWNLTNTNDSYMVSVEVLEEGRLLSMKHEGDPSKPPFYAIFFSENKGVLFTRTGG